MALTEEWKRRIERWKEELKNQFYFPLEIVDLEGFVTEKHLKPEEVFEHNFEKMPPGTEWGGKWEYGWFKGNIVLPQKAEGKKIVLQIDTGGESAVFINGEAKGMAVKDSLRKRYDIRDQIPLTEKADPGEKFDLLIESYAGHGPRVASTGPVPPERESVPEPPARQTEVGETTFGIWAEEVYQLWLDVETLFRVRENINSESLRVSEIDEGLKDFTTIVDLELPYNQRIETVQKGRERLKPLLECVNGSTAPRMYTFGHAHLDIAWLWPIAETEHKALRTYSSQLNLMKQYPEYKFLQSQPYLYEMVKEKYPQLFKKIKKAVNRGQFMPEGAMWVEADTNLSGGESLVRQFLYGKKYFREEFGIDSRFCWLPDVFGYSGAMPQIMEGCEVDYFATQKILWSYKARQTFPYSHFVWEGIDGSRILAHIFNDYNAQTDPQSLINHWQNRNQKEKVNNRLYPFGWGDGGGGPTRDHLEYLRRTDDLQGVPKTGMSHPQDFFEKMEEDPPENCYKGELYFQAHRGTYTSQAKTKKGNRKSEFALREAEMWNSISSSMEQTNYPYSELEDCWKKVLLNQFHDILPGSSIARVYDEAEKDYEEILNRAKSLTREALEKLTEDDSGITYFNSLSWPRKTFVKVPENIPAVKTADGQFSAVQEVDGQHIAEIELPACGWLTITPAAKKDIDSELTAEKNLLENKYIRIELDDKGNLTSIYDKENDYEYAEGKCNNWKMYKDVPGNFDAWDIDSMYQKTPLSLTGKAEIEVVNNGPLAAVIEVSRRLNNSKLVQKIILGRESKRVDFETRIDWQEDHKLLKVNFPVNIFSREAISEIQFGHIKRPTHNSTPHDKDQYEICNQKWTALTEANRGFAVLNDSKYGLSVDDSSINLTLLKAPIAPDMNADKGIQKFTYSIYMWAGDFQDSGVIEEAYDLNTPVPQVNGTCDKKSVFNLNQNNIILETVKKAEDESGDLIVRLYEAQKAHTKCQLSTELAAEKAFETNMLEKKEKEIKCTEGKLELEFSPFEIKTVRLKLK